MLTECYLPLTVEAKSCTANFPVTFTFIFSLILSFDGYCLRLTKTHCKDCDNTACVIAVRDVKRHRDGMQNFRELECWESRGKTSSSSVIIRWLDRSTAIFWSKRDRPKILFLSGVLHFTGTGYSTAGSHSDHIRPTQDGNPQILKSSNPQMTTFEDSSKRQHTKFWWVEVVRQ